MEGQLAVRPGANAPGVRRLSVRNLGKAYPGVQALSGVDLELRAGEILALLGPNGSGKTTLLSVLAGLVRPDSGEIRVDDSIITLRSPADAVDHGIALVTQEPELCEGLSMFENIRLGSSHEQWWNSGVMGRKDLQQRLEPFLALLGEKVDPMTAVQDLSLSMRQFTVLARGLFSGARILLLDEPTASMSEAEAIPVLRAIRGVADSGVSLILATHRADVVTALADRVIHLRDGLLANASPTPISSTLERTTRKAPDSFSSSEMSGASLCVTLSPNRYHVGTTFEVRQGEIIGLDGPPLAQLSELLRWIGGVDSSLQGEVSRGGRVLAKADSAGALAEGIAYVTSDRRAEGIFESLSISENLTIGVYDRLSSRLGVITLSTIVSEAQSMATGVGLVGPRLEELASTLSGGNQQKVILARVLATGPHVLLLDNATRGLDTEGRSVLMEQMRRFQASGGSCLVAAAEREFLLAVSDRVLVLPSPLC